MSEGINRAYELWRDSAEKYDYFMAGLCTAVLGYLAPKFDAARFGCNAETVELLSMLLFLCAVLASFKRLETTVHLQRLGIGRLEQLEAQGDVEAALRGEVQIRDTTTSAAMTPGALKERLEQRKALVDIAREMEKNIGGKAVRWYRVRDYLLFGGFALLIAARVWKGYR